MATVGNSCFKSLNSTFGCKSDDIIIEREKWENIQNDAMTRYNFWTGHSWGGVGATKQVGGGGGGAVSHADQGEGGGGGINCFQVV